MITIRETRHTLLFGHLAFDTLNSHRVGFESDINSDVDTIFFPNLIRCSIISSHDESQLGCLSANLDNLETFAITDDFV